MKKKSPKMINEQLNRIWDYYMKKSWQNGAPSKEERKKVSARLNVLRKIAWTWIDNIYDLEGVDKYGDTIASNRVWANAYHTKVEYMNN
nr:hypothetical protein [uncultured Prevotella sp.]